MTLTEIQKGSHIILAYNVSLALNEYFADNPEGTINKREFMDLQKVIWEDVKKYLCIKV